MKKNILVTGGVGYIGSHVVVELAAAGYRPVIIDNFSNSNEQTLKRLEKLIGQSLTFYKNDYQDTKALQKIIGKEAIDGVIHIAAYKAVGESVEQPLKYYENNVSGFIALLETLLENKIYNFVFSSSAAVYGNPPAEKVTEDTKCAPTSPYGWSKYMDELILRDVCTANTEVRGVALRYFNVVGSHPSVLIGESPKGKPQNLLPIIVQAVANKQPLTIYGDDYPTPDGTCLRDYIHVVDLAKAHVAAIQNIINRSSGSYEVYNLSTGRPTSVMELIQTFEKINKEKVPCQIGQRRAGDPVAYYAVAEKAKQHLGWQTQFAVADAVASAWQWHKAQNS